MKGLFYAQIQYNLTSTKLVKFHKCN